MKNDLTPAQIQKLKKWKKTTERQKALKAAESKLFDSGFDQIGEGLTRKVFSKPQEDFVLKLPIDSFSWEANVSEILAYKNKTWPVAKCRLVFILGVPVVKMEKVKAACTPQDCLSLAQVARKLKVKTKDISWAECLDCFQIGKTKTGKIVAFDAGEAPISRGWKKRNGL